MNGNSCLIGRAKLTLIGRRCCPNSGNLIFGRFASVRKDIHIPKVQDVSMAIVKETDGGEDAWAVYLINNKSVPIKNIIIASKGYGEVNDEPVKTSTLRHFFEELQAGNFLKVEPIIKEVFVLSNEYRLTFYIDDMIYDRKFIFVPGSVAAENLIHIPLIERPGILIK